MSKIPKIVISWSNGGISIIPGKYSNLYILMSNKSVIMVDTGFPSDIRLALSYLDCSFEFKYEIKFILLTHLHLDHVAGVSYALQRTNAKLALGKWAMPLLNNQKVSAPHISQWFYELIPTAFKQRSRFPTIFDLKNAYFSGFPFIRNKIPTDYPIWLEDRDTLPCFEDWIILHTPGHSRDSICLYNRSHGLLVSGDLIQNFLGTGEFTKIVDDDDAMRKSIALIRSLDLKGIMPGHGEPLLGKNLARSII